MAKGADKSMDKNLKPKFRCPMAELSHYGKIKPELAIYNYDWFRWFVSGLAV